MRFRLLGAFEAVVGDRAVAIGRRSERCLLALLLLEPDDVIPVDRLVDLLWSDPPPEQARRTIHSYIARLRKSLARDPEAPRIITVGSGYQMIVDPSRVDVHQFRDLVRQARRENGPCRRSDLLGRALALWRGPLLADLTGHRIRDRFSPALDELRLIASEDWLTAELALGRHEEALPETARLLAEQPGREKLVGLRMLALYRAGCTSDALAAYTALREHLAETTGADPGRELRDLHVAILRNDPSLDAPPSEGPERGAVVRAAPAELPPDLAWFTGRAEQLTRLDALLPDAGGPGGRDGPMTVITAIVGMAGIGKTTLAVHWAHRARERFPDGQMYVNLRGYDPLGAAVRPSDALRRLLTGLGVPASRVPPDGDSRANLYRSLLADRRVLVILDNARDAEQVRPLLAGTPGCLTVVTSRSKLTGLIAVDGVSSLSLDPLPPDEAAELLARRLGAERVADEPEAVADIVAHTGGLPLALAIVGARAAGHTAFPLAALGAELHGSAGLDGLDGVDPASDVRTVFSWSYTRLGPAAARLFRLLGLHPGPDVGAAAAASLTGVPVRQVRRELAELTDAHLVTEHLPGRYSMHDLVRAYAAEQVHLVDDDGQRRAALRRVLDHYTHTAHEAAVLRDPRRINPITLTAPEPGATPERIADSEHAQTWLTVELPTLIATILTAARTGFETRSWQLAWAVAQFLNRQARWDDMLAVHDVVLGAVERLGDREGQAYAHRFLAIAHAGRGDLYAAQRHYRHALTLFGALGDRVGQGYALLGINIVEDRQGRYAEALRHARHALRRFQDGEHPAGQAKALNAIGWLSANLGDAASGVTYLRRALAIHQDIGDDWGAAHNWDSLGFAHHRLGDQATAGECFRHAVDLFRRTGDSFCTASTLTRLGDSRDAAGDPDGARREWQEAVRILDHLEHPDAATVRARISTSGRREPGPPAPAAAAHRSGATG